MVCGDYRLFIKLGLVVCQVLASLIVDQGVVGHV
jgi:hypothetical protein